MSGLNSKLNSVEDKLDKIDKYINEHKRTFWDKIKGTKKKEKTFKLPNKIRMGAKRKIKQNYVFVLFIRTNGSIDIEWAPITNDLVYVRRTGIYYAASAEFIMRYKNFPAMILPEWNLLPIKVAKEQNIVDSKKNSGNEDVEKPFSPQENYQEASDTGALSHPERVVLQAAKMAEMKPPKAMGGKTLLWVILGAIVILYLISQMFGGGT